MLESGEDFGDRKAAIVRLEAHFQLVLRLRSEGAKVDLIPGLSHGSSLLVHMCSGGGPIAQRTERVSAINAAEK
jgi:hypothetical protein